VLRFAHFSVKEYLVSTRISNVSAGFRILDPVAHELVARISLLYLLSSANRLHHSQKLSSSFLSCAMPHNSGISTFTPAHLEDVRCWDIL
jgi:hypothetical protein